MSLRKKTIKGLTWDLSGRISSQVVSFIISIFLARILSPKDFGLLAMVNVVVSIANIFLDFGFNTSLVQKQKIEKEHFSSVFIFNIIVGVSFALLLFLFSGLISKFYNNELVKPVGRIMSLIFIINSFGSIFRIKLYKELNFKTLSIGSILGTVISGIVGVSMALNGFGVWSLVAQTISASLVTSAFFLIKSKWIPAIIFSIKHLKELLNFSFSIFISTLIGVVFNQLDNLVIGKLFSPSNLGYYYRAKSMEMMTYEFTSVSLLTVLFPSLSLVKDDKDRFIKIVLKSFHIILYFSISLLGFLYLTSNKIFVILFTEKWTPSVEYFNILLLSAFIYPINTLFSAILTSKGNSKSFLRLTILRYTILSITFFFLYFYGINTYLYSYVFFTIVIFIFSVSYVTKELMISRSLFFKGVIPYLLITLIITLPLMYLDNYINSSSILNLILISFIYFFLNIFIFNILNIKGFVLFKNEIFDMLNKNKLNKITSINLN